MHYHSYLGLDKILNAQDLESAKMPNGPAHDEMLFIIIHQVYELWFKQIIYELESVQKMFSTASVNEHSIGLAVSRLRRVIEIQELLIKQIRVIETITPLDFLEFRSVLFPASGFQSFQFRRLEVLLGLKENQRLRYGEKSFHSELTEKQAEEIREEETELSLFELIEDWLERTPFLRLGSFNFTEFYKGAVDELIKRDQDSIKQSELGEEEVQKRMKQIEENYEKFKLVTSPEYHAKAVEEGETKLSYEATKAALLINLYRDEPILHQPYNFLMCMVDIDELFTAWRSRHAQMVMRMIGKKVGTGGSSGHKYLSATAQKHHVFRDLHAISSLLIPRSSLPVLPFEVKKQLGFAFGQG